MEIGRVLDNEEASMILSRYDMYHHQKDFDEMKEKVDEQLFDNSLS